MAELYLRGVDAEQLRADIARDVVALLRPVLIESTEPRLVDFDRMLELLPVSRPMLERMIAAGDVPSVKVGRRRMFQPAAVVSALVDATANEAGAADE